jgi:hypothetical protein
VTARTQPFFIVSSGRSGTAMLHKALSRARNAEVHHEYAVDIIQPLAVRRYMGWIDETETRGVLRATYGAAVHSAEAGHWGDSSNKVSWLIADMASLFQNAKFVHLVRDGRKVASSYFSKLGDECYDDRSTAALKAYASDRDRVPAPPPEKKYWWPLARSDDPMAAAFEHFDQFQRIAWHWAEINRVILHELAALDANRTLFVRLEDLCASPQAVQGLLHFLNLPYRDEQFAMFARPHNVNRAEDRMLDAHQRAQFDALASAMMSKLGYDSRDEYVVKY